MDTIKSMDLLLKRTEYLEYGIFGQLTGEGLTLSTLEHAYEDENGLYVPKIPPGKYICERGIHRLKNKIQTFVTFQIMDVPDHTNCLFHIGNYNHDSDGCCLLGLTTNLKGKMVMHSANAFEVFMKAQAEVNQFQLIVE